MWEGTEHWSKFGGVYQYHLEKSATLKKNSCNIPTAIKQGDSVKPKGILSGSRVISKVQVTITDMNGRVQKGCSWTARPNKASYQLAKLNKKNKVTNQVKKLKPGVYRYQVRYWNKGASSGVTCEKSTFTVLNKSGNMGHLANFYLDSSPNRKYCVTPAGASKKDYAGLTLAKNNETLRMRYRARHVGGGYYVLDNLHSHKVLTVSKVKSGKDGLKVIQKRRSGDNGSKEQQWQIIYKDSGKNHGLKERYYYLIPRSNPSMSLTVPAGKALNKTVLRVQKVTPKTAGNQRWIMRPVRARLSKVTNTKKGLKLTWKPVTNASAYRIYRDRKLVHTVKRGKTGSWTDTKVSNGSTYTYKLVTILGEGKLKSFPCKEMKGTRLTAPKLGKVSNSRARTVSVSWKGSSKAVSYQVKVGDRNPRSCTGTHCDWGGLTPNRTYRVKVRAVCRVNGATLNSPWSSEKKVRVSK